MVSLVLTTQAAVAVRVERLEEIRVVVLTAVQVVHTAVAAAVRHNVKLVVMVVLVLFVSYTPALQDHSLAHAQETYND